MRTAPAQQPQTTTDQSDVLKITTSLVQTDVTVLDSRGKFVDDLKREQFVLKVDGQPRQISFFERVASGTRNEEVQLAAARGTGTSRAGGAPAPLDRGRLIFFYVDDMHLSSGSMKRTKQALLRFLDREIMQNDEVAIVSASGQIGFLQQMTDNKLVLRKAIERLVPKDLGPKDFERPAMSIYQAHLIERYDNEVLNYFVEFLVRDNVPRDTAERSVRGRASGIVGQADHLTRSSLAVLQSLIKNSAELPGRKLLFYVSDGFFVGSGSDTQKRIRDLTTEAARSGTVIYSLDARGLVASLSDSEQSQNFDPTGQLQRASAGELTASQDGMNAFAVETGGRAMFNSNDLSQAVTTALSETSKYYLLAWRPESTDPKGRKDRRLEISIPGRPELVVRVRRNFRDTPSDPATEAKGSPKRSSTVIEDLGKALRAPYPKTSLPVHVLLNFLNLAERGSLLATSLRVQTESIAMDTTQPTARAEIDIAGAIFNDQGTIVRGFNKRLTVTAPAGKTDAAPPEHIIYNDYSQIKPGLYQIRVAALEGKDRRAGSATEWIEIPDLDSKTLSLSSLVVAEKTAEPEAAPPTPNVTSAPKDGDPFANVRLSVDHRFARTSRLQFLLFIYNAAMASPTGSAQPVSTTVTTNVPSPDLAIQAQIFRDNEPVVTRPLHKVATTSTSDMTRIPFAADMPLDELQPGRYVLQVTVIDRISKTTASQQFRFQVE